MSDIPRWHPEHSERPQRDYGLTPEEQAALEAESEAEVQALAEQIRPLYENLSPEVRESILSELEAVSRRFAQEEVDDFDETFKREIPDVLSEGEE
jgi:stress response protein YsnF